MNKVSITLIVLLLTISEGISFDNYFNDLKYKVGLNGAVSRVSNNAEMPIFIDLEDCGQFKEGTNYGYQTGLHFNFRNKEYSFYPVFNLLYESKPVYLETQTSDFEVWDDRIQDYNNLIRNFEYDGTLSFLSLNIGVAWEPFKDIPFGTELAFDFSYPFFSTSYQKTEILVSPEGLNYPAGGNSRVFESGDLPSPSLSFAPLVNLYTFFETEYFTLKPSVGYRHNINSLTSDFEWKSNALIFSITLMRETVFELESEPESEPEIIEELPIVEEPVEDTVIVQEIPKEEPQVLPVTQFDKYSKSIPIISDESLNIHETIVTQTYPLLPYIFFDKKSTEILEDYTENIWAKDDFNEDSLPKSTLGIYYGILDIIAKRMTVNKESKLRLRGVTDGTELDSLSDRLDLAKKRAENVKSYFVSNWGIDESRIVTEARDYPDLPTNVKYIEGFAENRRVEIYSEDYDLLSPVIHSKFIENSTEQNYLMFYSGLKNPNDVSSYMMSFSKNEQDIFSFYSEDRSTGEFKIRVHRGIIDRIANVCENKDSIDIDLLVNLTNGESYNKTGKLYVNKSLNQFELGRLNLIVFDFDKANISYENRMMIDNFVKTSIQTNSEVNITGSSDILGEDNYNKELSQRRANNTMRYLLEFEEDLKIDKCIGVGSDNLLYDNATPEGRFYCRTVLIEVSTELDK